VGYDLRMGNPVYAIDEFPDDELPWRIEWIGGVGYNTSVEMVKLQYTKGGFG
jgi:hypothetical protein